MFASALSFSGAAEILKIGFSGLIFLLAYLGFRLLDKEQGKPKPNPSILKAIANYRTYTLVAAVIAIVATVVQHAFDERETAQLIRAQAPICLKQLERLHTALSMSPSADDLRQGSNEATQACVEFVRKLKEYSNQ
jgi:hypothetical protein